jgi:RND superfamily putative drug exporter
VAVVVVPLRAGDAKDQAAAIDALRAAQAGAPPGLDAHVTGTPALINDINGALKAADSKLLLATGALVLFLLLAIYRSPLMALVPLMVVGISYAVASGVIYLLAKQGLKVDSNARSLLLVLMFGAGTDYCLLLVARYSADLRRTEDRHGAMRSAIERAGPAMAASGITVMLALLTLLATKLGTNRVLGPVNAIGIAVVLLASLTLLPALLAVMGRRAFWPSGAKVSYEAPAAGPALAPGLAPLPAELRSSMLDGSPGVGGGDGVWRRVGMTVLKRPAPALVLALVLLGACAAGLTQYKTNSDVLAQFRDTTDGTRGYDLLRTGFPPGTLAPTTVLVERKDGPVRASDVAAVTGAIRATPGVAAVSGVVGASRDARVARLALTLDGNPYSDGALRRIAAIRSRLAGTPPGVRALLGDGTAVRLDYRDVTKRDLKTIVPLVLGVILLTLIVLLRALVAPLYLLATVIASFFAALGLSVAIFSAAFGQSSFDPALPIFAFIFLVALGVDYNIFLMSRVREEALEHGTRDGVLRALVATGPVITSAGIILAGTFAVLTTLPVWILLEIGFTVALGVLLDTFVVRTVLVPAIVELVGERSWWPSSAGRAAPVTSGVYRRPPGVVADAVRGR